MDNEKILNSLNAKTNLITKEMFAFLDIFAKNGVTINTKDGTIVINKDQDISKELLAYSFFLAYLHYNKYDGNFFNDKLNAPFEKYLVVLL